MKSFLMRWLVTTIAVAIAVQLTDMTTDGWFPLVVAALGNVGLHECLFLGLSNLFVIQKLLKKSKSFYGW